MLNILRTCMYVRINMCVYSCVVSIFLRRFHTSLQILFPSVRPIHSKHSQRRHQRPYSFISGTVTRRFLNAHLNFSLSGLLQFLQPQLVTPPLKHINFLQKQQRQYVPAKKWSRKAEKGKKGMIGIGHANMNNKRDEKFLEPFPSSAIWRARWKCSSAVCRKRNGSVPSIAEGQVYCDTNMLGKAGHPPAVVAKSPLCLEAPER